jgi:hypothetical protein
MEELTPRTKKSKSKKWTSEIPQENGWYWVVYKEGFDFDINSIYLQIDKYGNLNISLKHLSKIILWSEKVEPPAMPDKTFLQIIESVKKTL